MEWHYSDHSDDEGGQDTQATSRKRSSRACDQCRKTKSKCERPGSEASPCKSCALAGTACTFLGPSYKRGPPKGYIHAIEQRWHQVESLLGAIVQCPDPRVQQIVSDLRQDDLAREIIRRVDNGPYGPSGRRSQPDGATKEDFFASILKSNESSSGSRDSARSRRQSRVSREIVSSNQDNGLSVLPTKEWQDSLSNRLASSSKNGLDMNYDQSRLPRRRRLDNMPSTSQVQPDWNEMYTIDSEQDEVKDALDGIGELSLDENQEVRFHGKASGLHLLSRSSRTDDRIEGGIWRLPMARVWPPTKQRVIQQEQNITTPLPPIHVQDRLIDLYFNYVHPTFPVLHKGRFLTEYNFRKQNGPSARAMSPEYAPGSPRPDPSQELTPLLLFSMFAITARFCEDEMPPPPEGKMWEAGCNYLDSARAILTQVFHQSRPSTVQSLLLLGYREFGIGSMEQAWLFIGMAIRMATDLGLNCDSSTWKIHGHDLFSATENQTRCQIWWACCIADRYGSVYMGRPIVIKDDDFDTPLPVVEPETDQNLWPSATRNNLDPSYPPVPGRITLCFRAVSSLSLISGAIINKIYAVRQPSPSVKRAIYAEMETRLDQWYIGLPEELRFDTTSRRSVPPPHILFLHIRYWDAVLLLNRAFIPNWKGTEPTSRNTLEFKAFDLAQGAASHVSAIVTAHRETFTLKRSSPFLTSHLLSASIMHILTLTLRPSNVQASLGFQQCMAALKDMEMVWPSASRAWELLNGVKMGSDSVSPPQFHLADRHKRHADTAFGQEKSSDYLQREAFKDPATERHPPEGEDGVQELGTRIMAHMLGLHIPGIEPSTSYYPGYEWWPRSHEVTPPPSHQLSPLPVDSISRNVLPSGSGGMLPAGRAQDWPQVPISETNYGYDFGRFGL
ncbi:Nitrogen assimilation transcription factor nit-4 [Hypsizygus marmoreus]|uniref:Nitrogen assimilation transcription factor nit-4 n=1 Tax=Hypsizygus marmoreus TaxID=39966 RepID=A0A369K4E4_HYPMA|nr:Nitrogen assimilation transcription factor nit-4 [Hypsizygus marmoreus]